MWILCQWLCVHCVSAYICVQMSFGVLWCYCVDSVNSNAVYSVLCVCVLLIASHTYTIQKSKVVSVEKKARFSTYVLCQSLSQPVHFQLFDLSNFDRLKEIVKSNRLFLHNTNRCFFVDFIYLFVCYKLTHKNCSRIWTGKHQAD